MAGKREAKTPRGTLTFDAFWRWLQGHPNCIVRAGSPDVVLFDDEDYHWHFGGDPEELLVQIIRGKRLVGEIAITPADIAFVQVGPADAEAEEHTFQLIRSGADGSYEGWHFVLSHGLEEDAPAEGGTPTKQWTH